MVMKEIPREESSEEKPLLTMTSQLVNEQQESRPLLSPSIDDFLCETKSEAVSRPITSNTAVLSTGLDLLDLTEPAIETQSKLKKPELHSRSEGLKVLSLRRKTESTDLIKVDTEQTIKNIRILEKERLTSDSVPAVKKQPHSEKWDETSLHGDKNSKNKWTAERKHSSRAGSNDLLWPTVNRSQTEINSDKNALESNSCTDLEPVPSTQTRLTKENRWGSAFLSRNQSLEEEFEKAKAAVESDTEFWDKMEAEWEEMARRNWIADEHHCPVQNIVSPYEKGYYFHTDNPFKDLPNAFEEGIRKLKEGDLPNSILLLESAVLQENYDAEAWQLLGTTQAENENEQAAIVALQRCLEIQPNNLKALMALAVSLTNTGQQQEACEALKNWIRFNPKYKHLMKIKIGSPAFSRRMSCAANSSSILVEVKELYLEAARQNSDVIDPDLQTGLGVLFNLSGEYDRAVDAFHVALSVRPGDYLLWNRLGATLANGDRTEEAVETYTRALEIQPGFIRSRYNLGISCINLGAYKEAAGNFLTALGMQRQSRSWQLSNQVMSGNIWAALRIALSMMDQPELFQAANVGDLDTLMKAFNLDL
ncbi:PEX5-related protein [Protopterus annectens]|uniref:PEX5-related protein n=1 Tax=Protopterus annectens TaxID=7888 RepID=UPI001CFBE595|nr:PEX5-related protein [Protopterus annectens]